jgi:hypothetical protein
MRRRIFLVLGSALTLAVAACDRPQGTEPPTASRGATSQPAPPAPGADHAKPISPTEEPSAKEERQKMPLPGQANDHSSTARETAPSDAK